MAVRVVVEEEEATSAGSRAGVTVSVTIVRHDTS
jgi:hypothetical protein